MNQDLITDEEINRLAEWFSNLSISEVLILKQLYDAFLKHERHGSQNVH